jgi:hypothetical protein
MESRSWLSHRRNPRKARSFPSVEISAAGPRPPKLQEIGSYLGYTGRAANVIASAALDPNRKCVMGKFSQHRSYELTALASPT